MAIIEISMSMAVAKVICQWRNGNNVCNNGVMIMDVGDNNK